MGFDLNGENKKGEETYFRANVWTWRPLWKLVCIETNLSSEVYEGKKNKKDCVVCTNEYSKQDGIPIGKQKNFQTSYFLDKDTFKTFVKFCKESIGFNIN